MSAERIDTLRTLAKGVRKFSGMTAQQVIDAQWPGLKGLHAADMTFFRKNGGEPVEAVARACLSRNRYHDPIV